jgi:F-type H+-transporting ATPase subunit b
MMGFSWLTFGIETANFLVLMWLLNRLVYRPLKDGIQRRRDAVAAELRKAEELRESVAEQSRELAERTARLEGLRTAALRKATEEASEQRARMLEQAREDATAERARGERLLEVERAAARVWVREVAVERGSEVAARLLLRIAPEAIDAALFEALLSELEGRRTLLLDAQEAAHGAPLELEVAAITTLDRGRSERLRDVVETLTGVRPHLVLKEDDALGAGLVVRVGHHVLDASVAGQLDAFRQDVRRALEGEDARV